MVLVVFLLDDVDYVDDVDDDNKDVDLDIERDNCGAGVDGSSAVDGGIFPLPQHSIQEKIHVFVFLNIDKFISLKSYPYL